MKWVLLLVTCLTLLAVTCAAPAGSPTPTPTAGGGERQASPATGAEEPTPTEVIVEPETTPRRMQEVWEPAPHVRPARLSVEYKWLGSALIGLVVNRVVENSGGPGLVEVEFEIENQEVTSVIVSRPRQVFYLEAGERREVSTFVTLTESKLRDLASEYGWKRRTLPRSPVVMGGEETTYEIPIRVSASPIQVNPDALLRDLESEELEARKRAAQILGEAREGRAVEPLMQAFNDQAAGMRLAAARALGKIGDERAVEPLILALGDEELAVRAAAAEALGKLKDGRAVEPLMQVLDTGRRLKVTAGSEASWIFGDKAPVSDRLEAVRALGQIGDRRAVGPLIQALEDEEPWIRHAAAEALGKIGDPVAIGALTEALDKEEDSNAKEAMSQALAQLGASQ